MTSKRVVLFLLACLIGSAPLALWPETAGADPPIVTLHEAHAFECVVECDATNSDALILIRYKLPTSSGWRSATCDGTGPCMTTTTCTDANNYEDACYTSLLAGTATMSLLDTADSVVGLVNLPRVGAGLSAVYLCKPASLICDGPSSALYPFDDPLEDVSVCIKGPSTLIPQPTQCLTQTQIHWHASSSLQSTVPLLIDDMVTIMRSLQTDASVSPTRWITNGVITEQGALFALEAFSPMPIVAPALFASSILNDVVPSYDPPAAAVGNLPDQTTVLRTQPVYTAWEDFASMIGLGGNGSTLGGIVTLIVAVVMYTIVVVWLKIPGDQAIGLGAAWWVCWINASFGLLSWQLLLIMSILIIIIGAAWWVRNRAVS